MARSSRDSVCLEIVMRNSSQSHWIRVAKAKRMGDVSIALFARFASNNRIGDLLSLLSMHA